MSSRSRRSPTAPPGGGRLERHGAGQLRDLRPATLTWSAGISAAPGFATARCAADGRVLLAGERLHRGEDRRSTTRQPARGPRPARSGQLHGSLVSWRRKVFTSGTLGSRRDLRSPAGVWTDTSTLGASPELCGTLLKTERLVAGGYNSSSNRPGPRLILRPTPDSHGTVPRWMRPPCSHRRVLVVERQTAAPTVSLATAEVYDRPRMRGPVPVVGRPHQPHGDARRTAGPGRGAAVRRLGLPAPEQYRDLRPGDRRFSRSPASARRAAHRAALPRRAMVVRGYAAGTFLSSAGVFRGHRGHGPDRRDHLAHERGIAPGTGPRRKPRNTSIVSVAFYAGSAARRHATPPTSTPGTPVDPEVPSRRNWDAPTRRRTARRFRSPCRHHPPQSP
jgi:hypothetical protein